MTRLAWLTDTHFNCLKPGKTFKFGKMVAARGNACIITGDIAEGDTVCSYLDEFQRGFGGTVYFVLGNHDRWKSSFKQVEEDIRALCRSNRYLHWLGDSAVRMVGHTQLCGVDGWYDYSAGDTGERMGMTMHDWHQIKEFEQAFALKMKANYTKPLIDMLRELGQESAIQAKGTLSRCDKTKPVLFATHVPPFKESHRHNGRPGEDYAHPFYTNISLGWVLNEYAKTAQWLTTICGHSHSKALYRPLENHQVITGGADYGNPKVNQVFDLS